MTDAIAMGVAEVPLARLRAHVDSEHRMVKDSYLQTSASFVGWLYDTPPYKGASRVAMMRYSSPPIGIQIGQLRGRPTQD